MSVLKLGLWAFIGVLGAGALAIVSGLVSAHEKVNGLWLVIAAACIYVLAYRFYGRWLACRVASLDNHRLTPAVRLNDGVNFHPTNRVVLFVNRQRENRHWLSFSDCDDSLLGLEGCACLDSL